jgi:hypothetical protein
VSGKKWIIPNEYNNAVLKKLFLAIQAAFDFFDGAWIRAATIAYSKLNLSARDIPPSKIDFGEWLIPFSSYVTATTDTGYTICSDVFQFDPAKFPAGAWHFEATVAIADASATVTAHLMPAGGSEVVGSPVTHTGDTSLTPKRSTALTMPSSAANLYCEFKTSNASYAASFAGAKLVFVPS